jgi:Holliday junction resolvase
VSNSERRKGANGEREVAAIFRAAGFDCDRTPNSGGLRVRGDLAGTVPAHVEVKRQEALRLPLWLRQAESEAPPGVTPVVAFRQSHGVWYAALPLEHLAALMAAAENFAITAASSYVPEEARFGVDA